MSDFTGNHGDLSPTANGSSTDFFWGGNGTGLVISSAPVSGSFRWRDRVRAADVVDGLSHTLLVGERHLRRDRVAISPEDGPAYDNTDFYTSTRVGGPGAAIAAGPDDDVAGMGLFAFGSWHPGRCHMAFGDGRVEAVDSATDTIVLGRMCNRKDGH